MTIELPEKPESRKESYLAKIAGQNVDVPEEPLSRIEQYLAYIAENGGGGGGGGGESEKESTATSLPFSFSSIGGDLMDYAIYGNTVDGDSCGIPSANMFNKNAPFANTSRYISASGSTSSNSQFNVTSYIEVLPETTYTLQSVNVSSSNPAVCFYDESEVYISGTAYAGQSGITFTTPAGCKYIKFSVFKTLLDTAMLHLGSGTLPYEPYETILPVVMNGTTYNITLDSPLRKIGDVADYIIYSSQERYTYISNGTVLSEPIVTEVDLPTIAIISNNTLDVGTSVKPSKVVLKYMVSGGGGGGGVRYKAGDGISIFGDTISADTTVLATNATVDEIASQVDSLESAMPVTTLSGTVVSFVNESEGAELTECIAEIVTKQTGSGTPTPSNVRPFVGYPSVDIYISPDDTVESAESITVTFPEEVGTVYRGRLDVVTGKLTVTAGYLKLVGSGSEGLSVYSGSRFKVRAPGFVAAAKSTKMAINANCFETVALASSGTAYRVCQGDSGSSYIVFNLGSAITTVELANEWLAEHNVEIVYPLSNSITYQLTPTQVMVLLGQNYIWSNASAVGISYMRNIKSMIDASVNFITDAPYVNVYNPNDPDIIVGQQIKGTGEMSSWGNCSISGFIPCAPGDVFMVPYYTGHFGTGSGARGVPIYDVNKEYVGSVTGTLTQVASAGSDAFLKFTITPTTAAYFRVNALNKSANAEDILTPFHANNNFMVIKGAEFPDRFYPYIPQQFINGNIYSGHEDVNNPLYGKKAVFLGDSICEAAADTLGGWPVRIGHNNSMISENDGIGGTCISTVYSANSAICKRAINTVNPDYIIFEGGTNDADRIGSIIGGSIPAGFGSYTESDWGTDDAATYYGFDIATFCGAFEYLCKRLTTTYAGAKIGYICAQKMGTSPNYTPTGSNRRAYFETAMNICKKWGIPYINLWDGCYLNPKNPAHYTAGSPDTLYVDGQHLTTKGYDYITPMIEAWMKTL